MNQKLNLAYWKGEEYWVGKLLEYPEIMSQGETIAELEENIRDAYLMMAMEDVPSEHQVKELEMKI